jgi:predicted nucleic acid-binding protein
LEGKPIAATLAPGNSLIAATALAYGFIVVTRNAHDISMSA